MYQEHISALNTDFQNPHICSPQHRKLADGGPSEAWQIQAVGLTWLNTVIIVSQSSLTAGPAASASHAAWSGSVR